LLDDMKMNTKNSGNSPCTASPEPVNKAAAEPSAPKARAVIAPSARITSAPAKPASRWAPAIRPTRM
jgi:hypothetical protein